MAKRNKNRRRLKKTKYLSLTSLRFPPQQNVVGSIPLSTTDHHHIDYFLSSASDDGDATTLTALLLDSSSSAPAHLPVVLPNSDDGPHRHLSPSAASVSYVSEAMNLVRTALRSRERESTPHHHHHHPHHHHHHHVERYVRYSEVVDDRRDHEEVSSRVLVPTVGTRNDEPTMLMRRRRLALKLDYQEIINAWSDKGGFYVSPEFSPQTVPDVNHHPPLTYGGGGGLWSVPEGAMSMLKMKKEEMEDEVPQNDLEQHRAGVGAEEDCKWKVAAPGQREASVMRYKEKRRNRLFSKTIRYQVRKENAQKRPRVKGRFVKRS